MSTQYTNIGKSKMKETPDKSFRFLLKDNSVQTRHIAAEAVTPEKLSDETKEVFENIMKERTDDLQNQIDSLQIHGMAVSNMFGSDTNIGVSQATLTEAFNKIWQKFEEITGEVLQGINMVVTPPYFMSEDGCDIHVTANAVGTTGVFERIRFYVDGDRIYQEDDINIDYVSFDHHLDIKDTYDYVLVCRAQIMGIVYTARKVITRYNEFYIGAGDAYEDVMDSAHARQLNNTMRHSYDVTFADNDKLIIVMGATLRPGFIRADLNGAEIPMTETTVTIDGKQYSVFTSDTWSAGDYNIDING